MEEKRIIYYARTYRRIRASRLKCVLYMVFLILPLLLFLWLGMAELTGWISRMCVKLLRQYAPGCSFWIRVRGVPLFGKISFVGGETVYPSVRLSLANAVIALLIVGICVKLPWKGRPAAIYVVLNAGIHLVNSLWFFFGGAYFPYSLTTYSELYMLQEIGIWLTFLLMSGLVTGIVGERGFFWKFLTVAGTMVYSVGFGVVRYVVFLYLLQKYSILYMALFYFLLGPMFDFMYLVMFYGFFVNRMIHVYESGKGKGAWQWS